MTSVGCSRPLLNLAALINAMELNDVPFQDWIVLRHRQAQDVLAEVIRATMIALDIRPDALTADVTEAYRRLGDDNCLPNVLPSVKAEPKWTRCLVGNLNAVLLANGLIHPSLAVVIISAQVLCHIERSPEVMKMIQRALETGNERTLKILAECIDRLWGEKGAEILLARLGLPLTEGCEHLYGALIKLANADQISPVLDVVLHGIRTCNAAISKGAVEALANSDRFSPDANELNDLLDLWTKRGSQCERCEVEFAGKFCPQCHLGVPTPRAGLVKLLIKQDYLTEQRLLELCDDVDSDVQAVASAALAKVAVGTDEKFNRILSLVNCGDAPICILRNTRKRHPPPLLPARVP
jgi:hypothetical protein